MRNLVKLNFGSVAIALAMVISGCTNEDVGERCGTDVDPTSLITTPVGGETAVNELIRIERDSRCKTFVCLRHGGLEPYCTQECSLDSGSSQQDCSSNDDCTGAEYCFEGKCWDDDCPGGFWCRKTQEAGPASGQSLCIKRDDCSKALDCEAVGSMTCVVHGCFDACLNDSTLCEARPLSCLPEADLPCNCEGGAETCSDEELRCATEADSEFWPTGSVARKGICTPK